VLRVMHPNASVLVVAEPALSLVMIAARDGSSLIDSP